jgi:hypothetical protein
MSNLETQKQPAENFLDLFSTTLRSLAADASAVREISNLAELIGLATTESSSSAGTLLEYRNGNGGNTHGTSTGKDTQKDYYQQQLGTLDRTIANLEEKVIALREIINEENRALAQFETSLQGEAAAQASLLSDMLEWIALREEESDDGSLIGIIGDHIIPSTTTRRMLPSRNASNPFVQQQQNHHHHHQPSFSRRPVADSSEAPLSSISRHRHHPGRRYRDEFVRDDSFDEDDAPAFPGSYADEDGERDHPSIPHELVLSRVSKAEVEEHSRNVPSGLRISRFVCNEALEEIEDLVRKRTAAMRVILEPSAFHSHHSNSHPLSTNALQRRFDYLRQRQGGRYGHNSSNSSQEALHAASPAHAGQFWVTEQELRENCAFFRHGESTARATLALLCSLKRLKQLPGKNMEITYICLHSSCD